MVYAEVTLIHDENEDEHKEFKGIFFIEHIKYIGKDQNNNNCVIWDKEDNVFKIKEDYKQVLKSLKKVEFE